MPQGPPFSSFPKEKLLSLLHFQLSLFPMHYLSVENISKAYVEKPLFQEVTFHINEGDRIALIALNGSGKSTLLKIIAGIESPDSGTVQFNKELQVVMLPQRPKINEEATVLENIFTHDHPALNAIKHYEAVNSQIYASEEEKTMAITEAIQQMNDQRAWNYEATVKQILSRLNINRFHQLAGTLSGGQQKRLALAKILIDLDFDNRHSLLIFDEPTNHLDVEMIEWLEYYLTRPRITLLFVTHDRYFLDQISTKVLELSDQRLYVHHGDYDRYLQDKAHRLEVEQAGINKANNRYRKELEWMRKQPRARSTKSRAREEAFYDWKAKAQKKMAETKLALEMKMTRLGGKVLLLKKLRKAYGPKTILDGFDYTFKRGERIGIIGPNGVGKSTFINIILQKEAADSGKIEVGDTVVFGDFSQEGLTFKEDIRVMDFVKRIAEFFPLADGTKVSAARFLERFLFPPDKQYTFVSKLSGGELKRLQLLSILFKNPNFLVLDEPTNDLDLPTLEVLEEFLLSYTGCVLIVSHDRYFMDKVVDHLFVFEGEGVITDFPGNYAQYREQKAIEEREALEVKQASSPESESSKANHKTEKKKQRLSYKEKREMEQLEQSMAQLNEEKEQLKKELSGGQLDYAALEEKGHRLQAINEELDLKEFRWLELSELEP